MTRLGPALAGIGALLAGAAIAGTAERQGEALAGEACASCHQVRPGQARPKAVWDPDQAVAVPAPSFMAIARDPAKNAVYIRAVLAQPHAPMKEQLLSDSDREALVRYILSLAPRTKRGR